MKNFKSIFEGISSQGKMMGSRGSSFRDSSSSSDQNSGLSIGASRAKDHEDATKDASIASEKNRKNEIEKRNKEAEQRQKETMQMSQEETVTEAKHVFHVHLHPIDTRLGKMVDDKTVEPIGNKPKGDKIKLTIPAADTRSARDKATRYAAKNFGVDNVKSIEYKGLHEETVTEAKMTKKFVFDKPYQPLVKAYSNHDTDHLKDMHKRWSEGHQKNMKGSMDTNTSEKLLAVNHVLKSRGEDMKMPEHKNLGMHTYNMQEETNTEKRMKIKNVARMDDVEPTSEKSTLSKTGSIKTKIVEEKPTMSLPNFGLSASLIAAARQIVEKKDDVKLTGGKTQVEVEPETDDRSESDEDTSTSKKKKKLDSVGKEDDDVDNDGDSDKSDSYLKNRRKAIGKAIKEDRYSAGTAYWTKHPDGPRSVNVSPSKTSGSATIHYIETDKPGTKSKEVPTSELRHPDNMSKPFVMKENEQLDEGPFTGIGKMLMKRKLKNRMNAAGEKALRFRDNPNPPKENPKDPKGMGTYWDAMDTSVRNEKALKRLNREEVDLDERENSPYERASDTALDKQYGYGTSYDKTPKTSFGRAANRSSAAYALRALRKNPNTDTETGSDAVHQGWAKTATTSTDQTPEKKARRATLASTPYSKLPDDEKEKDRVAFNAVKKTFNKESFTADELARIDEIAQSIFEVGTDGLDSDKKYAKGDVTNAVLSDEKKQKMNKK